MAGNIKVTSAGSSGTTTVQSNESTDRTLTLPDATDTLVGKATTDILTNKSMGACTITVPNFTQVTGGTLMTTPTAGVQEADSAAFYSTMDVTNGRRFNDNWNYFR